MAKKPFYSIEEVSARLGKTPGEIKDLVRDGTLREFRDAGKIFFKAEDVDKLTAPAAAESEDSGEIALEPLAGLEDAGEGSGELPSPRDSSGGTSVIGLEPLAEEETGKKKEDTVITASGIGVFDDDELEIDADPMAKTQITTGATDDQISLEGAGSGSGLLDLAREADDTALGADLLDEIYPGEEEAVETAEPAPVEEEPAEEPAEEEEVLTEADSGEVLVPVAAVGDVYEGLFSGLLVGGLILMALACSVVAGVLQGYLPNYGQFLSNGSNFFFFLGGSVVLAAITLVVGWFVGKAFAPRQR